MPVSDSADLVLYYAPRSRAVTALRFMEELDRPYRLELVDLEKGDQKRPAFMALNPMGKIPLVVDGGVPIAETGAIFVYLADKYAPGRLAPAPDSPARAHYLRWMFFAAGVMEPAFGQKIFKWDPPARQVGWGSFDEMLRVVTEATSQAEWLAGDFSAADIYVASTLGYGIRFGILPDEGPTGAYVKRWLARPAAQRADAVEAEVMAKLGMK